jgi:hypothetical protein
MAQQIVEAFPWDAAPKYLLRYRNSVYGAITYSHHPRIEEMKYIKVLCDLRGYKLLTHIGDGWADRKK